MMDTGLRQMGVRDRQIDGTRRGWSPAVRLDHQMKQLQY